MSTDLQTIPDLTADWIRRVVTYTDEISYFGENSVGLGFATATAQQTAQSDAQYRAMLRRFTLLGASGAVLEEVAEEMGARRLGEQHAVVLVIVQPWVATVTAITGAKLEVDDSTRFEVGDSVRIASSDGATTETAEIVAITTGTGPSGGDELEVGAVFNSYDPSGERVVVMLRHTLPAGTVLTSTAGLSFQSLEDVTTGDANPVMAGESVALALADKVWCEAVEPGAAGNVEAQTITAITPPDPDVRAVLNPGRAMGGGDEEAEFDLKYRAAHLPQVGAAETLAFLETLATRGNSKVLRAFEEAATTVGTIRIRVMTRSGGGLSADERAALGDYVTQRMRSQLRGEVLSVIPTAVEVVADVTLQPGPGTALERLTTAWRAAADRLATFIDWRKWPEAASVDPADLLAIVDQSAGIATVATSSFQPSELVTVPAASIPVLVRLTLTDTASGETFGAVLSTSY